MVMVHQMGDVRQLLCFILSQPCVNEGAGLNAHDVANRTMRQANILITL